MALALCPTTLRRSSLVTAGQSQLTFAYCSSARMRQPAYCRRVQHCRPQRQMCLDLPEAALLRRKLHRDQEICPLLRDLQVRFKKKRLKRSRKEKRRNTRSRKSEQPFAIRLRFDGAARRQCLAEASAHRRHRIRYRGDPRVDLRLRPVLPLLPTRLHVVFRTDCWFAGIANAVSPHWRSVGNSDSPHSGSGHAEHLAHASLVCTHHHWRSPFVSVVAPGRTGFESALA